MGTNFWDTDAEPDVPGTRAVEPLRSIGGGTPKVKKEIAWSVLHFLRYRLPYQFRSRLPQRACRDIGRINLLAVENCTNRCKHCSTSSPFAARRAHQAAAFIPWLNVLSRAGIEFKHVSITGGEPFLHPNLGQLIGDLHSAFPNKEIGLTTNFFWANEQRIQALGPKLKFLTRMLVSRYPNIVQKLGGKKELNRLLGLVRKACPHIEISVADGSHLIAWQLHDQEIVPQAFCCTSDCYVLRVDGNVSHCAVGGGLDNRPENASIVGRCNERLFDLKQGTDGFIDWVKKYPLDLCSHCTLWRGDRAPWETCEIA